MPKSPASSVEQLSRTLAVEWLSIAEARTKSDDLRNQLTSALAERTSEDKSIVVFGSLARRELTDGSDLDWVLLVDGQADPGNVDDVRAVEQALSPLGYKPPGREGIFGDMVFSHDLVHNIGGSEDSNRNLTLRMLSILEATPIGRDDAFERVLRNILWRYIAEDYGWSQSQTQNVPRFLLNDIVRYWRTLAVDFGYKRRDRAGAGWALRTIKLRMSRKLSFASGMLMCYQCALDEAVNDINPKKDPAAAASKVVAFLAPLSQTPALDILAAFFIKHAELADVARELFAAYDDFLGILNDRDRREHLERLTAEEIADDNVYQQARVVGHRFRDALGTLFFSDRASDLLSLTKAYGVF